MSTLADFRANAVAILGLDATNDQTLIDFYANEAVREILLATRCYVTSTTATGISTSDSDVSAILPSGFLDIVKMYWTSGGSDFLLERRQFDDLVDLRRNTTAVGPTKFYAFLGANLIAWHPAPASGDTLTIYYVPYPTAMSSPSHDPSSTTYGGIPKEQHNTIESYVLWKMADAIDDASSQSGRVYEQNYEKQIAQFRRDLRKRGGDRQAPIPLPSRRRKLWLPRPDQIGV